MEQSPTTSFSLSIYLSVFCPRSVLGLTLIAAGDEERIFLEGGEEVEENPPETSNDEGGVRGEARWATTGPRVSRPDLYES